MNQCIVTARILQLFTGTFCIKEFWYVPYWSLCPLYSEGLPLRNTFRVGYPVTSYFCASSDSKVASTLANLMGGSFSFKDLAAFSYTGARCLQCPHLRCIKGKIEI